MRTSGNYEYFSYNIPFLCSFCVSVSRSVEVVEETLSLCQKHGEGDTLTFSSWLNTTDLYVLVLKYHSSTIVLLEYSDFCVDELRLVSWSFRI
jgi:hypothetical protein